MYATADVRYIRLLDYLPGIVAPVLGQLIFKRSPSFVLGVHIVLINCVLKEFSETSSENVGPCEDRSI